jgi:DNA-binding transcriptional ArsR family regulator
MPLPDRRRVTDIDALRTIANPVRYRILGHLMAIGPQTASQCAAVVGETASNCSYHLRELARFGLVERVDDGPGDARERPWRSAATGWEFRPADDARGDAVAVDANRGSPMPASRRRHASRTRPPMATTTSTRPGTRRRSARPTTCASARPSSRSWAIGSTR